MVMMVMVMMMMMMMSVMIALVSVKMMMKMALSLLTPSSRLVRIIIRGCGAVRTAGGPDTAWIR
eukprot:5865620-Pyramimonas_sp.AAC.1